MEESKRSAFFGTRTISRDVVVPEYPDLGLIAFFTAYTFGFTALFDRLFGLPTSARAQPLP